MSAIVSIVGANSVSALLLDDPTSAEEVLSSLKLEPATEFACTFDATGKIVARYGDQFDAPRVFADLQVGGNLLTADGKLQVMKPIVHGGKHIGTIFVRCNLDQLHSQLANYAMIVGSVLALTLAFAVLGSSILQRIISRPVERLATAMRNVSDSGNYSLLADKTSEDELGTLCDGFNEMLEQIQWRDGELNSLHEKLVQTARQAGQAEIATSVLHNVGNVLNSVNVTASLLAEWIQGSQVTTVEAIADLILKQEDVGEFFTNDDRGKMLPGFLAQLGQELNTEQQTQLESLSRLQANIEHIKQIVRAQQSFAGLADIAEPCELQEVIEEAYAIAGISAGRHGIEVEREIDELPAVQAVRSKLLQILVNLIKNAKEALKAYDSPHKTVTLRLGIQDDFARVEIADNGPGIDIEKLNQVFAYGFTTKPDGHGFGLHSSANAAKEMGGALTAHSDGPGCGATFFLDLPLRSDTTSAVLVPEPSATSTEPTESEPELCEASP
ncbi:MAG: HAMP domain-containing protein [Planctomycetes bacterium]|nr:HAMP domain-containing protein [Planctomycetota bacterium]